MSTEKAIRLFKTWHKRDPDKTYQHRIRMGSSASEEIIPQIGNVLRIDYFSNKWSRRCVVCGYDGDNCELPRCPKCNGKTEPAPDVFKLYTHKCESKAPVYAATSKPDTDAGLLVKSGESAVTYLAYMAEIEVLLNNGKKSVQGFAFSDSSNTPLYCLPDRKTLVVAWERRPMVIKGSRMKITAHGIER